MSATMGDDGFDDDFSAARAQVGATRAPPRHGGGGDGASPSPDDPDCPIRPLGHRRGHYWLFSAAGEIRELTEDKLDKSPTLTSLLGGRIEWALAHFVQLDREGNPTAWFNARRLGQWIVEQCHAAGLFSDAEPVRGWGVWRAQGVLMVHLGDRVWIPAAAESRRAGFRDRGALWPALPRALPGLPGATPLPDPAPPEAAATVEAVFGRWNWEQPWAPQVVTGLWAAGLFGAGIRWRPHGLVVGQAGAGKSTLFDAIAALSPLAAAWNDYTEAGLRQALTGRAAPLMLDEAEGDPEGASKLGRVIELLRRASGGAGAQTVKGSPGGQAMVFEVTSQAIMGAILPPVLLPQDASRFTRVDVVPPGPDADAGEAPRTPLPDEAELLRLRPLGPALLARAVAGAGRMAENVMAYRAEIMRRGCAPRLADQLGTILAARATLLHDAPAPPDRVRAECDMLTDLLTPSGEVAPEDGPGAVLMHLLQSRVSATRKGERPTIGALLQAAQTHWGTDEARVLREHGIGVAPWPAAGAPLHVFIANSHPALREVYAGTRWADGRWREDLRRLPGACMPPGPRREAGPTKPRCTVIPMPVEPALAAPDDGGGTM